LAHDATVKIIEIQTDSLPPAWGGFSLPDRLGHLTVDGLRKYRAQYAGFQFRHLFTALPSLFPRRLEQR
jgi:hypothetical protein